MKITPRKTIVAGEMLSVNVRQRLAIFCALLLLTLSLAFALSALASDFWIRADSMRRNGTQSRHNQMNSGLFHGVRQLDWAFGPKQRIFSVFDELQSGVGFMDRHIWFGILLSLGLGLIWNFVGIFVALRNATLEEDDKHARTALGPWGLCLWALLGAISYGTSLTLFQLQFQSRMRVNVLLPEELAAGFSSENCVFYGFSYFLGCSAMTAKVIVLFILFCAYRFGNCGKRKAEEEAQPPIDDSVFIY